MLPLVALRFQPSKGAAPGWLVVALRLRIEHVQDLLRTTDLPQCGIAAYCGSAHVHHFSKAFKRITRLSPGAYRRG